MLGEGREGVRVRWPGGKETLADLFGGRSQLIVYHFMLVLGGRRVARAARSYRIISTAAVCTGARDVRLVVVSRAPLGEIEAFRSGSWRFHWVSSNGDRLQLRYQVINDEG